MAQPSREPNVDVFEAYFLGADLDRDARVSCQEAVAFFQGFNLPEHILAQIKELFEAFGEQEEALGTSALAATGVPVGTSALAATGVPVGAAEPASNLSQVSMPRITPSALYKYTKVFVEVDKDRNGKITGEEARNLFLSWRLPREVLKQLWDLSDRDNDGQLSLREFCTALYLMEWHREGRPLPAVLPNSLLA